MGKPEVTIVKPEVVLSKLEMLKMPRRRRRRKKPLKRMLAERKLKRRMQFLNEEFREKERLKSRERQRRLRENEAYRQMEREKNLQRKREQRSRKEYRLKDNERQRLRMKELRKNEDFRRKEREQNRERLKLLRQDEEYREKERERRWNKKLLKMEAQKKNLRYPIQNRQSKTGKVQKYDKEPRVMVERKRDIEVLIEDMPKTEYTQIEEPITEKSSEDIRLPGSFLIPKIILYAGK